MVISKTPLRCSFFGGGTDFRDYYENAERGFGTVLSTALDMHVYVTASRNFDNKVRLCYYGNELVDHVDEVKHNIIREALRIVGIERGIEIFYTADIPLSGSGVGLASSSALAVGVLNALHAYCGQAVSSETLAREACEIEIQRLGQHIGIQDQYAVSYGGFRRYRFYRDGKVSVVPAIYSKEKLKLLENRLMLFFTGLMRKSGTILVEQEANIGDRMHQLDCLADMVDESYEELASGKLDAWGGRLDQAWNLKKQLAGSVSNTQIDDMYERARMAGATGGKVLGAGGGGFLLLYVREEAQEPVRKALSSYREIPFFFEPEGSHIVYMN